MIVQFILNNRFLIIVSIFSVFLGCGSSKKDRNSEEEKKTEPLECKTGNECTDSQSKIEPADDPYVLAATTEDLKKILSQENPPKKIKLGFEDASSLYADVIKEIDPDFKKVDVSQWDVSSVTNMSSMFWEALSFNQPIDNWDVSNVTDMSSMFALALNFNQSIDNWDVSNVTDMASMFYFAKKFNQPIGNWDVSSVTNMTAMFQLAESFNQPIGNWNVSKVKNMAIMFSGAYDFNQQLNNWDVKSVKNMIGMFNSAKTFNHSVSNWSVLDETDTTKMFVGSGLEELPGWYQNPENN